MGRSSFDAPDGAELQVTAAGFAPVSLTVGADAESLRVVLQPAPLVDTVVVTATRGAARLATPEATTVLTSAELLTSPAGSLDDALRNTPGFSLFRRSSSRVSNPTTQGVTLRGVSGSGASRTLVLADGVPLNDPFGSWVYWNRVPQAAVDRVEVVRGATGDLYGADALGGVVQVLTFAPGRTRFRATGEGGSHDTAKFSGFGGTQREAWSAEGAGEWVRTDGVVIVGEEVRGPVDVRADSDYASGFVGGGYNPGNWHAIDATRLVRRGSREWHAAHRQFDRLEAGVWRSRRIGGRAARGSCARPAGRRTTIRHSARSAAGPGDGASDLRADDSDARLPTSAASGRAERPPMSGCSASRRNGLDPRSMRRATRLPAVPSGPFVAGGTESSGALFARVSTSPLDRLTVVLGVRGDFWQSTPRDARVARHIRPSSSARARLRHGRSRPSRRCTRPSIARTARRR